MSTPYIEEVNKKLKLEMLNCRSPIDEIVFLLMEQYGFNFSYIDIDTYENPIQSFNYESNSEILSTPEFLKEIKKINRKANDLGMEVFFGWVELFGVSGKYGMQYDKFMSLYGGKRYLNKARFKKIRLEVRVIYPD